MLLPGWAVEGGDHPGLVTGQALSSALEFAPVGALTATADGGGVPSLRALGEDHYRVEGRVLVATDRLTVIDVGVPAFAARRVEGPHGVLQEGDRFAGDLSLGLDPFLYRVFHAAQAGARDITRSWTVVDISVGATGQWAKVTSTDGGSWRCSSSSP